MKSLRPGNYALSIAHPGHELRLHGFLEQTSPYVFILTDGSDRTGNDMMMDSIRVIDKATKHGKKITLAYLKSTASRKIFKLSVPGAEKGEAHLRDTDIYNEVLNQHTGLFEMYINFMATNLIKYKIDYVVADPNEEKNIAHEVTRMLTDLAIELVYKKNRKEIISYDFAIDKPYDSKLNDQCIHIKLDEQAVKRKLDAIHKFPLALLDMKPNISLDASVIIELNKMPDGKMAINEMIGQINPNFIKNEYLRPYVFTEPAENPLYQLPGADVIRYQQHLKPLKEKLKQLILNTENAAN